MLTSPSGLTLNSPYLAGTFSIVVLRRILVTVSFLSIPVNQKLRVHVMPHPSEANGMSRRGVTSPLTGD
jgi:hypothetical protein